MRWRPTGRTSTSRTRQNAVRKVSIATGETTTLATGLPNNGIAIHGGFLYVGAGNVIKKVEIATGVVSSVRHLQLRGSQQHRHRRRQACTPSTAARSTASA